MDLIRKPVRIATSKPAQQTYLNTLLFIITSTLLFGLAVCAYILFYFAYIPQIGIERVIHLQYGYSDGPNPYGIAPLSTFLISQQPYDITLTLHLPRSPPNLSQGNFMLALNLLSPAYIPTTQDVDASLLTPAYRTGLGLSKSDILFSSRRPAILRYTSRLVSLSERVFTLPLYVLGWRQEAEVLRIPMAEGTEFPRGRKNIPGYVMLEVQAGQEVQVYDVRVQFKAQFVGLRWVMYNHRIISFITFTTAFWVSEMVFALIGWLVVRVIFASKVEVKKEIGKAEETDGSVIKEERTDEEPDLSDTPRTFPTYGRQAPLRFVPKVKEEGFKEEDSEEYGLAPVEADDEDEEEEGQFGERDSGIGTSFSEGGGLGGVKRRRSRSGRS